MFPPPAQVLKAREGSLTETPLPQLLQAIRVEERTCTLELRLRQIEKRIDFEEGAPTGCRSNLLHETLGKFLVERGKLPEAEYQKALAEQVQSGKPMGDVLVAKGLLPPFELYKQLQANVAFAILDCFRWAEGAYRLRSADEDERPLPVKMNAAQLLFTGITGPLPFELVTSQFPFAPDRKLARVPGAELPELKLAARDVRFLQALKAQPTFDELVQRLGLETEDALRRLYAFTLLGLAGFADTVPAARSAPEPPAPGVAPPPPPPAAPTSADEDPAARDAVVTAFLEHRGKDPFQLLGVGEDATHAQLRVAFLAAVDRFNPMRFRAAELKDKAETLLMAYARAFGALSEPDQRAVWKGRREAARAKAAAGPAPRASTAEQFKIQTGLLDASHQLAEGKKRLEAQNFRGALQYFEYARDIDPKPVYRAYTAWARYLVSPSVHARLALGELASAVKDSPDCEEAHFFMGEILREAGDAPGAESAYLRAQKINPRNRRYGELIAQLRKG